MITNGEVLRASARQSGVSGQDVIGVFYYRCDFSADQLESAVLAAVVTEIDANYTYLNAIVASSYNPVDIKVDVVQLIAGEVQVVRNVGTAVWTGTYNPSGAGDDMPPGACAFVKLLTDSGKTFGRKFISGLLEARGVSGFIDATAQTALGNFIVGVLNPRTISAGNDLIAGVLSKKHLTFKQFYSGVVSATMAYQRRRKFGVGS